MREACVWQFVDKEVVVALAWRWRHRRNTDPPPGNATHFVRKLSHMNADAGSIGFFVLCLWDGSSIKSIHEWVSRTKCLSISYFLFTLTGIQFLIFCGDPVREKKIKKDGKDSISYFFFFVRSPTSHQRLKELDVGAHKVKKKRNWGTGCLTAPSISFHLAVGSSQSTDTVSPLRYASLLL